MTVMLHRATAAGARTVHPTSGLRERSSRAAPARSWRSPQRIGPQGAATPRASPPRYARAASAACQPCSTLLAIPCDDSGSNTAAASPTAVHARPLMRSSRCERADRTMTLVSTGYCFDTGTHVHRPVHPIFPAGERRTRRRGEQIGVRHEHAHAAAAPQRGEVPPSVLGRFDHDPPACGIGARPGSAECDQPDLRITSLDGRTLHPAKCRGGTRRVDDESWLVGPDVVARTARPPAIRDRCAQC